ncbi:MAG TPA: aspartate carbamoyltransferase catalytic subunit [Patescibacteria group bacterium]|nr:aspartate carbamoyltransferase catalytic subunit [Patescibacteria group bacterium]
MAPPRRHLITLSDMSREEMQAMFELAERLRAPDRPRLLAGKTVVNLFFEPSTRTRVSFELAALRLGADVVPFDVEHSSTQKGETLLDTLRNLEAMGCDQFVVRHKDNGTPGRLAEQAAAGVSIINAGDGNHAHPTQGLLDAFTILRHKPDLANRSVAIVGDILHSRVARSDIHALLALGVGELRVAGPEALLPGRDALPGCIVHHCIDDAVRDADVIIMLRLQKERMTQALIASDTDYFRDWGLDETRLGLAHPEAIVMHPGPINRNVEIADGVADGAQSRILEQVANGVAIRMAVMATLAGTSAP